MKSIIRLMVFTILFSSINSLHAQISGTVFRDINGNGTIDTNPIESGVGGIVINVYNTADALAGTATSATAGTYTITPTGSGPYRIEFVIPSGLNYYSSSASGNVYGSSARFVTTGTQSGVNFALFERGNFSNKLNPSIVGVRQFEGAFSGVNSAEAVLYKSTYLATGNGYTGASLTLPTGATRLANMAQIGTVYGVATQTSKGKVYAGAFHKRYAGFGPNGPSAIYQIDTAGTGTVTGVIDLSTLTSTPNVAGVDLHDFVARTRSGGGTEVFDLGWNGTAHTNTVFSGVGTRSLGDVEISGDEKNLYVINLLTKQIYALDISTGVAANTTLQYTWAAPDATSAGRHRPFALKWYRGLLYVGSVDENGTNAYVHSFNPNSTNPTFTLALTVPLGYGRQAFLGSAANNAARFANWRAWATDPTTITPMAITSGEFSYPQAILSDIQFDAVGDLVLGFRDRWGDQTGYQSRFISTSTTDTYSTTSGDILKACFNGTNWSLEATSGCNTADGMVNSGPGAATLPEHYEWDIWDDGTTWDVTVNGGGFHWETAQGALVQLPGSAVVMTTAMDPMSDFSGGLLRLTNATGRREGVTANSVTGPPTTGGFALFETGNYSGGLPASNGTFGKGNGLGDVELLGILPQSEIGNRVWNDANGDGIQNPGEAVLSGVALELFLDANNDGVPDGAAIGSVTTNATGNYIFSSNAGTDATGIDFGVSIAPNQNYIIRVASSDWASGVGVGDLAGYQLTKSNKIGNGLSDISDNDASLSSGATPIPQIRIITGSYGDNNHTLDFGFKQLASIGNKVWLDNGAGGGTTNDGIQNGTEPGVAGVTITLYQNGTDGNPGTTDDIIIGSTVTDAYGVYLFDNLTASTNAATSYNVGFTLPANYQFTTQTNTQVTGTSNATNTTTTTGGSTAANGSDANTTTGRTGSFFLASGEAEMGADAGIIFNTPVLPNSIGDRVWFDNGLNGGTASDGIQNGAEPGVAGVTVQLLNDVTGNVLATTITDANGNYLFTGLLSNTNYKVKVIASAGTVFATTTGTTAGNATTNSDVNATLTSLDYGTTTSINTGLAGNQITGIDAGLTSQANNTASLGDKVWNDLNANGTQDAGEPGIGRVVVNLYEDANGDGTLIGGELTIIRTTTTDAFGNYNFNNLIVTSVNRWQVGFVEPAGFDNTPVANNNSDGDVTDSDITDNTTDRTGFIRLLTNQRNSSVDAGFVSTAPGTLKLGDKVWRDDNSNGILDATEPGVAGVTVKLCQNGTDGLPCTLDDVVLTTTSTDEEGNYLFTNLSASAGSSTYYNVQFSNVPSGFSITTQTNTQSATGTSNAPTGGATNANGNDANIAGKTGSYNLTADNLNVDAGIKQGSASGKGSLGNKVWIDVNGGTANSQDNNEPGVADVTVNLYRDANGDGVINGAELVAIATEKTNALGEYIFDNLDAGTYQVGFSNLPSGYSLVSTDAVTDDNLDSDGNSLNTSVNGNTAAVGTSYTNLFPLEHGQDNLSIDLGLNSPANTNTLGNFVWFDTDSDGIQDASETGLAGVLVSLVNATGQPIDKNGTLLAVGAGPITTITNEDGHYLFTGLSNGTFGVKFSNLPAGLDNTTKSTTNDLIGSDADRLSGTTPTVTLNYTTGGTSRDNRSLDAGIVTARAVLGNKVWDDLNGDGVQNANEPGVPGVTVILYAADASTVISSTITNEKGNYLFANLNAGTYVVGFSTLPNGKEFTQQNTPGDNADDTNNDAGPAGANAAKTDPIVLTAGEIELTIDAGVRSRPVATVGNRVWDDLNNNGIQDAGEPGISGVIATLFDNTTTSAIGSAITNSKGEWLITNVSTGSYYVAFNNKPAGAYTLQDQGANAIGTGGATESDTDSDVNIGGQTGVFTVAPNTVNVKIDAGITQSVILPIDFILFNATKVNNTADLNFEIGAVKEGTRFVIERSKTGNNFAAIGTLNATRSTVYSFTDIAPILNDKNYYRIKAIEASGEISYSTIRTVRFADKAVVEVFPNPASNYLSIKMGQANTGKTTTIRLVDGMGRVVLNKQLINTAAVETINVANYATGTYNLQLFSNSENISNQKIMIIK